MTSYRLAEGMMLAVRVSEGPWQSVTFRRGAFADITAATAEELAAVMGKLDGIEARVHQGRLVLVTEETGEGTSVEVDLAASTAAGALGIAAGAARGSGPGAAQLTGAASGPFSFPKGASMTLQVDGKARKLVFNPEGTDGPRDAGKVASVINSALRRRIARPTGDGRLRLVSPTLGVGSRLSVSAPAGDAPDAAQLLGLVGAQSEPYRSEPARLVCPPAAETTVVENLTATPIELYLPAGRTVLPARGRRVIARDVAADALLQRLLAQGSVRMSPERKS